MLRDALNDSSSVVRYAACEGLGGVGSAAKAAIPALVDALDDEELSVRDEAVEALKKIDALAAAKAGVR
jgi:HEAT repeat protein